MFRFKINPKKIKVDEDIVEAMSSTLGHNLRTSFVTIQSSLNSINKILPTLICSHKSQKNSNVHKYSDEYLAGILQILENSGRELSNANYFLNKFINSTTKIIPQEGKIEFICLATLLNMIITKLFEKGLIHCESTQLIEVAKNDKSIIQGDPRILENCFSYLLDNCAKLCKKGVGEISLNIEPTKEHVTLRIAVISPLVCEIHENIFLKFQPINKIKFGDGMSYAKSMLESYNFKVNSSKMNNKLEIVVTMHNCGDI